VYRIEARRRVQRELNRLPWRDRDRIEAAIDTLAEEPRPSGCKSVRTADPGTYRQQVGDYRMIYIVRDAEQVIVVARTARRGEDTYEGL